MNLTANMGLGRSMGAAFLMLCFSNQPILLTVDLCITPGICSLSNRLRHNPEWQLAGQRRQLRMGDHLATLDGWRSVIGSRLSTKVHNRFANKSTRSKT